MTLAKRNIKVFLASPGDLSNERKCFRQTIRELNAGFGDGANVQFIAQGWEDCYASYGRRSQSIINELIDDCEIFILAMHERWGQEASDAYPLDSYTEEEFQRAQALYGSNKSPRIFAFFKNVELNLVSNPDVQLEKVLTFKRHLEETKKVIHRPFNDESSFKNEIEKHLKAYVKDELPDVNNENDTVVFPIKIIEQLEEDKKLIEEAIKETEKAKDAHRRSSLEKEELELDMAEAAASLSKKGEINFAREKFARLTLNTKNKNILYLAYEFFYRISDFKAAGQVLNRALEQADSDKDILFRAEILGNLGNMYREVGNNALAKSVTEQALKIFTRLGKTKSKANSLQCLGAICFSIGDIQAENYYKMALDLFLELELELELEEEVKEGIAVINSNLGDINASRGEYPEAKDRYEIALSLYQELDHVEGVPDQLGKLAVVYLNQGKGKEAEAWLKKALAKNRKFGRKIELANNRNTLGLIYMKKPDYPKAEKEFKAALEISTNDGFTILMVNIYGNLANLYASQAREASEFEVKIRLSESMYKKALAISEASEYKRGIASQKLNLGVLYLNLDQIALAEPLLYGALAINKEIGEKEAIALSYSNIGALYLRKGLINRGISMAEKAMVIFVQLKSPHTERTASLLRELKA